MSLKGIARETLDVIESGYYTAPSGRIHQLREAIQHAVRGTRLYTPEALEALQIEPLPARGNGEPTISVTAESSQQAVKRLYEEGCENVLVLNFASAKNPGGGFLNGAKAQEEDIARCSAIYPCLLEAEPFYLRNRNYKNLLYTHNLIFSPRVPFFRVTSRTFVENPFFASVITAPAPNAGCYLKQYPEGVSEIEACLRVRAGYVLSVAADNECRNLVLGAWGCGVFQNEPEMVASIFAECLSSKRFRGCFDEVVFAVYDKTHKSQNYRAFLEQFHNRNLAT